MRRGWGPKTRAARVALCCLVLSAVAIGGSTMPTATGRSSACDEIPTGVASRDHWLHFKVPAGLMPDPQFDGRPAKLEVRRVSPVYANGKCPDVATRAAVLIHGRSVPAQSIFDLQHKDKVGNELSVQAALARAGIDTFAPNLLGFGRSTRFDEGLNDPGNASLRGFNADGSCSWAEGCDRTNVPFALDQQGTALLVNPLGGARRAHSSNFRFGRTDLWVRDIRHVIDDAIARARPTDGRVTLVGYSAGGQRVGRTLYAANPVLPGSADVIAKVNRVVFLSSIFGGPTEEVPPPTGLASFPLAVNSQAGAALGWSMPDGRDAACPGHIVPGSQAQSWQQTMEVDTAGRDWGGTDPLNPTGLNRSPTFFGYGWNAAVAGQLTTPTLVMQGLEDQGVPGGPTAAPAIYNALPASMANKLLVQVECASHQLPVEGCEDLRCTPSEGTVYGAPPGSDWAGPHATLKAALVEWITSGTFNGAASGRFVVNASGVATQTGS